MSSFDVESLFTNVPLQETIDLVIAELFKNSDTVGGFNDEQFKDLLILSCTENVFLFDGKLYLQLDGVSMGGCLSPILANAFLCIKEREWLENCPDDFKPNYYRRYVDDTFLLFKNQNQIPLFKQYLNSKHPNIQFTSEIESNSQLPFIGVMVTHAGHGFSTTIYHKPTDTGLGINYHSFTDSTTKSNSILTLVHRCFAICSSWFLFHEQIKLLHVYYQNNRFPSSLFWKTVKKFLNRTLNPPPPSYNVPKDIKYVSLPFFGHQSYVMRNKLAKLFSQYFPQISFRIILSSKSTIGTLFPVKERLPSLLCSNVIYKYTCGDCQSSYVGSTIRCLRERAYEHMGKSFLTGNTLKSQKHTNIRIHSHKNKHSMSIDNFKIIGRAHAYDNIRLLETVYIKYLSPDLNDMDTAMPLHIL